MTFSSQPLQTFLDQLASAEPIPGGGSVAALSGALGASLVAMVCRLTIGKKGYEAVSEEMQAILSRAEKLQTELGALMQADTDAYARVMDAFKLPKSTDNEKAFRAQTVQAALKNASDIPLHVAELCAQVLELTRSITAKGNKNAASDGAVGAVMAEAGLRGATLNVLINLKSISDPAYVTARRARVVELEHQAMQAKSEILQIVDTRL